MNIEKDVIINQVLDFLDDDCPRVNISAYLEDVFKGICKEKDYTGKKDINNKKIYNNSSILLLNYFSGSDRISDYGYFLWDNEDLRYNVSLIGEMEIVPFENSSFDLLEIVDTVQQNKLGLIK